MKRSRRRPKAMMTHTFGDDYLTWEVVENHHLEKNFTFPDFITALEFVNRAGQVCEEHDHHAEFVLSWGNVCVRTWSHDTDSITERDYKLAESIDGVFSDGS